MKIWTSEFQQKFIIVTAIVITGLKGDILRTRPLYFALNQQPTERISPLVSPATKRCGLLIFHFVSIHFLSLCSVPSLLPLYELNVSIWAYRLLRFRCVLMEVTEWSYIPHKDHWKVPLSSWVWSLSCLTLQYKGDGEAIVQTRDATVYAEGSGLVASKDLSYQYNVSLGEISDFEWVNKELGGKVSLWFKEITTPPYSLYCTSMHALGICMLFWFLLFSF